MYFVGRSRGVKVQWGYLKKNNKSSSQLCVIMHRGKSVVKHWIRKGETEREREIGVNKPRIIKKMCVVGYRSVGMNIMATNAESPLIQRKHFL